MKRWRRICRWWRHEVERDRRRLILNSGRRRCRKCGLVHPTLTSGGITGRCDVPIAVRTDDPILLPLREFGEPIRIPRGVDFAPWPDRG